MNQKTAKTMDVRTLVTLGMLCAVSYVVMLVFRLPIMAAAPFLKLDIKDVIIAIGGLIYGPLAAGIMSLVVSFLEMITVSESGWIGLIMNFIGSASFACTAAFVYKKRRSAAGATVGLVLGALALTATMLAWNYLIIPFYQGWPREAVAAMLVPVFLPFNLIKGALNVALVLLLYKPVVGALRSTGRLPKQQESAGGRLNLGVLLVGLFLLISAVLFALITMGIL